MPKLMSKRLRDLTRGYETAYATYKVCVEDVATVNRGGGTPSPGLLIREESALLRLRRRRARLLAEMAFLAKTP
jgi:hypothetical protein